MNNCVALALIEFDRKNSPSSKELSEKYKIPVSEIWKGFAQITAGRSK